ncbi:hypothetical protein [Fusobacterium varium]
MKKSIVLLFFVSILIGCESQEELKRKQKKEVIKLEERIRILEDENSYLKDPRKILIEIIKYNLSKEEYDIAGKNLKELKMLSSSSVFKEEISILEKEILYYENLKKEKKLKVTTRKKYEDRDYYFDVKILNYDVLPFPELLLQQVKEIRKGKDLVVIDFYNKDNIFLKQIINRNGKYEHEEDNLYFEYFEKDYIKKLKGELMQNMNLPLKYYILDKENNGSPGINLWIRLSRKDKNNELDEIAKDIIEKENLKNIKVKNPVNNMEYHVKEIVFFFYLPNQVRGTAYRKIIVNV